MKILLTSTSFQDTPGMHQEKLNSLNFDVDRLRGPLTQNELMPMIDKYDALICGDDELTDSVLKKGSENKLKFLSKYGVGLDKIDLAAAKKYNIKISNCTGVNHITVAEHVFALLLSYFKNIPSELYETRNGNWTRLIGHEIHGKKIAVLGLGKIGKEVVKRAIVFGLKINVFDKQIDNEFCQQNKIDYSNDIYKTITDTDIISLHLPLLNDTKEIISKKIIVSVLKRGVIIVNTARAGLINLDDLIYGLDKKIIGAYLTDVLDTEPMPKNHPLIKYPNVFITPHIGSRTFQSVERQGSMAVENLLKMINEV